MSKEIRDEKWIVADKMLFGQAVRELLCQRCHREHPVWFAPNDLWNAVAKEGEHFMCPTCFVVVAEARGIKPTAWCLRLENEGDGELAIALRENKEAKSLITELEGERDRLRTAVEHIRDMPVYDQDDHVRVRDYARRAALKEQGV